MSDLQDRAREWLNENGGDVMSDAEYDARLAAVERELAAIDAADEP